MTGHNRFIDSRYRETTQAGLTVEVGLDLSNEFVVASVDYPRTDMGPAPSVVLDLEMATARALHKVLGDLLDGQP